MFVIHPSITVFSLNGPEIAGAYHSCHLTRGRLRPAQVASQVSWHKETLTLPPLGTLIPPVKPSPNSNCISLNCTENLREPTQTWGEQAKGFVFFVFSSSLRNSTGTSSYDRVVVPYSKHERYNRSVCNAFCCLRWPYFSVFLYIFHLPVICLTSVCPSPFTSLALTLACSDGGREGCWGSGSSVLGRSCESSRSACGHYQTKSQRCRTN